ncbi:chloroplastic group IIA intron splicing facilitator CRS1, chloroplastic isoform X2 [Nymphaea colorata]|uniref:chloroplastic group IIA intron splicing facilitator CRS1, chloroplastic isoform X2 n=1 Tax=Nymphaea colorata TaxID=210225 RepID=UPI00129DE2D7|nr:chloroplastic group IIA intron splicing facilitator CRS1, chloroplastic isoform X2 [Nymphaea colorata]
MEVLSFPPLQLPPPSVLSSKYSCASTFHHISLHFPSPTIIRNTIFSISKKISPSAYDGKRGIGPTSDDADEQEEFSGGQNFDLPSFLGNTLKSEDGDGRVMVKLPVAPWMKEPIVLPIDRVLDLSKKGGDRGKEASYHGDRLLTGGVRGGRGRQAMRKIIQKVNKLGEFRERDELQKLQSANATDSEFRFTEFAEKMENGIGGKEQVSNSGQRVRLPWARAERVVLRRRVKKDYGLTSEKLGLSEVLLSRLRVEAEKMKVWVKATKAGVTQEVVDRIGRTWKKGELAMVKFDVPLCHNMDRAREIVETKTGGTVIWIKKDRLVVYRGCNYDPSSACSIVVSLPDHAKGKYEMSGSEISKFWRNSVSSGTVESGTTSGVLNTKNAVGVASAVAIIGEEHVPPINGTLFEREADRLLDGLGPRFVDWWWAKPLPVDADLLPEVVPGYMTPLRHCPPHVRPTLTDDELTYLRKIARTMPTHFALGRNSRLQGLAHAILKLWQKNIIAKIALKRGIANTNNEQMAEELKCLTGGVLILRNKFFILLYRGKDFIPHAVSNSLNEREAELENLCVQEENARRVSNNLFAMTAAAMRSSSKTGTFSEFQDIRGQYGLVSDETSEYKLEVEVAKVQLEKELRKQERKLKILIYKWKRSEVKFSNLNSSWRPTEQEADTEIITEEEKQSFRKIGLKMDEVLLLGRRGVYDGVIGSIHQHWKHREIVKVITMQRTSYEAEKTARMLEAETGGILVGIEKLRKGHAIIIYRGKNYRRPLNLLPENLLTKKMAFERSVEIQRRGSLKFFARQREKTVERLRQELADLLQNKSLDIPGSTQEAKDLVQEDS